MPTPPQQQRLLKAGGPLPAWGGGMRGWALTPKLQSFECMALKWTLLGPWSEASTGAGRRRALCGFISKRSWCRQGQAGHTHTWGPTPKAPILPT